MLAVLRASTVRWFFKHTLISFFVSSLASLLLRLEDWRQLNEMHSKLCSVGKKRTISRFVIFIHINKQSKHGNSYNQS